MTDVNALTLIRAREALSKLGAYRRSMVIDGQDDLRAAILDASMTVLRRDIASLEKMEPCT